MAVTLRGAILRSWASSGRRAGTPSAGTWHLGARMARMDPKTALVSFQRLRLIDMAPIDGDDL